MTEHIFSIKRLKRILCIMLAMILYSAFIAVYCHYTIDRVLILIFLNAVFLPFFIAVIELERMAGHLNHNKMSDLTLLAYAFAAAVVLYALFTFLPAYMAPVMLPALLLTAVSNEMIGAVGGIYLSTLFCLMSESSYYEYAAYTLLTVLGCTAVVLLSREKLKLYGAMMLFALTLTIPCLFYYISSFSMNYTLYLYALADAVLTVLFVFIFFDRLYRYARSEKQRVCVDIINGDYPLVQEVKRYSDIDYMHAVKVSNIAHQCAAAIGADERIAAAAGFYYRIGKLEGEPFVENGVSLARLNCFPEEVIQILVEYNGEEEPISSIESALVHMVDILVTKFELLDRNTLSSSWNHDMVIYQTLNEKSSEGIYDKSGLGMNQFLKIREYLAKGVEMF